MSGLAQRASIVGLLISLAGCQAAPLTIPAGSHEGSHKTYIEQQAQVEALREKLRPIIRQSSVLLPIECEIANLGITDPTTRAMILDIAANAGIYGIARMCAPDPRAGLADLIVTSASVSEAIRVTAASGPYPSMDPLVAMFSALASDLHTLGGEWLTPQVMAEVEAGIVLAKATGAQSTAGIFRVNELLATHTAVPRSLQIDSSFVKFDDGGLLERGLDEIHAARLAVREVADVAALLPQALDYRMRRVLLLTLQDPALVKLRTDISSIAEEVRKLDKLDQLGELSHLSALDRLEGLNELGMLKEFSELEPLGQLDSLQGLQGLSELEGLRSLKDLAEMRVLIVGGVVVGLALQGAFIAWAVRRR